MKKLLALLLFILAYSSTLQATQLTGTLEKPDGTGFSGTLYLSIAQQVGISSGGSCGGPVLVVPTVVVAITITNGNATWPNIYGGECTLPQGMPYNSILKDQQGNTQFSTQWLITGPTQNVGSIYQGPAQVPPTAFVAIPGIGTPTANNLNPCSAESMYVQTDAASGSNLWPCVNNVFVQQGGSGGSGGISIYSPVTGGAVGSVLFVSSTGLLAQDSLFNYNASSHVLSLSGLTVTNPITGSILGNAGTATALAAIPSFCTTGQFPRGVDKFGNALFCAAPYAALTAPGSSGALLYNASGVVAGVNITGIVQGNGSIAPSAATSAQIVSALNTSPTTPLAVGLIPALPYLSNASPLPLNTPFVASKWFSAYNATTGVYTQTQPTYADIAGTLPPTISSTQIRATFTVGAISVAASNLVKFDTNGNVIPTVTSDSGALGIAEASAASGASVIVDLLGGTFSCIADNNTTINDLVTVGTTTAASCRDSGVSVSSSLPITSAKLGRFLTATTAGGVAAVFLYGPGHQGTQLTTSSGTVTSVGLSVPAGLSVGGGPITTSGTLALTWATGQTAHQVIGTCGIATTVGLCSLVAGDIPAGLPYLSSSTVLPSTLATVAHKWLNSYTASTGIFTQTQPAFTDISGIVAALQLPTPTTTTLGGIQAVTAVAHNWVSSISVSGVPALTQPTYADIAGTVPTWNQATTGQAGTVATIAGLISASTNITITGAGTVASPYAIASSGGGSAAYTTLTSNIPATTYPAGYGYVDVFSNNVRILPIGTSSTTFGNFEVYPLTTTGTAGPILQYNGTTGALSITSLSAAGQINGTMPGTASNGAGSFFTPALATGNSTQIGVGAGTATSYSSATFGFTNAGGSGSSSNYGFIALGGSLGSPATTFSSNGSWVMPGALTWGGGSSIASSNNVCLTSGANCPSNYTIVKAQVSLPAIATGCGSWSFSLPGLTSTMGISVSYAQQPGAISSGSVVPLLVAMYNTTGTVTLEACVPSGSTSVNSYLPVNITAQ